MTQLSMHQAAKEGCTEEIIKLVEAGVGPDGLDDSGLTPLYWAAYHDHPKAICILIEAGADPRVRDQNGRTPLHWVSFRRGRYHTAYSLLVGAGADVNAKDKFGWTASLRPTCNPYKDA